jgi:hypothetical protein
MSPFYPRIMRPYILSTIVVFTIGLFFSLPPVTSAQSTISTVDCSSPQTSVEQTHCRALRFFEDRGLPMPQCTKHPMTYGEPGWRNKKGELIAVSNMHHLQKQNYCKVLGSNRGVTGAAVRTPASLSHPPFIYDPTDIGPEPKCSGITTPLELSLCKVQHRTWRILDRQIKWQQRQDTRQLQRDEHLRRIDKTLADVMRMLSTRPSSLGQPTRLPSRSSFVERMNTRASARDLRMNSYRGYIRPAIACRTVPVREKEECLKGYSN